MVKFACVFLGPLIPLCVVVLVLKERRVSDNQFVALCAKVGGPAATYTSFALLALKIWNATSDGQSFHVRVNDQAWRAPSGQPLRVELRCDDDEPVLGSVVSREPSSIDVDFEVPSRWSGHKVELRVEPSTGSSFPAFILRGRFREVSPELHVGADPPSGSVAASPEVAPAPEPGEVVVVPPDLACPPGMLPVPGRTLYLGMEGHMHEARLSSYCVDRTEVTVAAYNACARKGACAKPAESTSAALYKSDREESADDQYCNRSPTQDTYPMNCVNWQEADEYCRALGPGYRLPTEDEWQYAATGPVSRRYPWGNEAPDARRLNACGAECSGARMYAGNDGYPASAPVGSFPAGASYFGALDMAGNVWEWTASWFDADQKQRVDRGGGWRDDLPLSASATHRSLDVPELRSPRVGFRCIWVPATHGR